MNGPNKAGRPGSGGSSPSRRVAIGYHFFPHYRAAILEELCRRGRHRYVLVRDRTPIEKAIKGLDVPRYIPFIQARWWTGGSRLGHPGPGVAGVLSALSQRA